jgi:penicillin-binding protein 2
MLDNPFKIQEGSFREGKIKNFTADREEGDAVYFSHSSSWIGKSLRSQTTYLFYGIVILFLTVLISRATYLQVLAGERFLQQAEGNRLKQIVMRAPRGIIYDRNGKPLVYNSSFFFLYINPPDWPTDEAAQNQLSTSVGQILGQSDWHPAINVKSYQPVLVAEKLPYDQALRLLALSRTEPSLQVTLEPSRSYISDNALAHIVGYTGSLSDTDQKNPKYKDYAHNDILGKNGIELEYENYLRGQNGYEQIETDALGRDLERVASQPPVKGKDIYLTIDLDLQKKLYNALEQVSVNNGKKRSAGIVMDPRNGEILAAVSLPSFDNNLFSSRLSQADYQSLITNEDKPLFMRLFSGEYPPGSTFKIVMASAGLQENVISTQTTVNSTGGVKINNSFFPDWRPQGHGITNIYHALADSVNTFFYILGGGDNKTIVGLGLDRIRKYADLFNLGRPVGVDFPSEADGFVPSADWKQQVKGERWYLGDTYNLSIGQGDLTTTPLQVAYYTSIIASKGNLIRPHFLKAVSSDNGAPVEQSYPVTKASWLNDQNIAIVTQGLKETVINGTAKSLQAVAVPVAGKTGTAQFNKNKNPHSWFTGWAPADNPELQVTILVEEGGDIGYAVTASRLFLQSVYNK